MRKRILTVAMLLGISLIVACGNEEDNNKEAVSNSQKVEYASLDGFAGESGYIVDNMTYDYSKLCDKVYEYDEYVKLPFKPIENAKIATDESGQVKMPIFKNVDKSTMADYIESLREEGYTIYENQINEMLSEYEAYKDNLRITFMHSDESKDLLFFIYSGNVIKDRKVSKEDARKLIDDSKLLDNNKMYSDFHIIEYETKSIIENGYYEFLIFPATGSWEREESVMQMCYYMITDGKEIVFFEEDVVQPELPNNANMIKGKDGIELIATMYRMGDTSNDESTVYICKYELKDNKFSKTDEINTGVSLQDKESIVSKIENNSIKYYKLKEAAEWDMTKDGNKNRWIIDGEYTAK